MYVQGRWQGEVPGTASAQEFSFKRTWVTFKDPDSTPAVRSVVEGRVLMSIQSN